MAQLRVIEIFSERKLANPLRTGDLPDGDQVRRRRRRLHHELFQTLEHAGLPEDVELHVRLDRPEDTA